MNLDDLEHFARLDTAKMIDEIDGLPDQLLAGWQEGSSLPLPLQSQAIRTILISGMGGSAIGADLLAAYIAPFGRLPVIVQREYGLPAWAHGADVLVVASSHSGNTEETLDAYKEALERGCQTLAITAGGGKLAAMAEAAGNPLWRFAHYGQPRAAVGYAFSLLLALVTRLGVIPDPHDELLATVETMRKQQVNLGIHSPVERNPAKRMAGQLYGRWVTVFGAEHIYPVARRWKGQINELAKGAAQFEAIPEADHNTLAGVHNPPPALLHTFTLFLRARSLHPRNRKRINATKRIFMLEALNTDFVDAIGDSRLAEQWSAIHFGDYTAYYLAMAYGIDPTPVDAIESLKKELRGGDAA